MKTKLLKSVLPTLAIVLAMGLAFASEHKIVEREAHYYLPGQGWQTIMVTSACQDDGKIACTFGGLQLYSEDSFASVALRKD